MSVNPLGETVAVAETGLGRFQVEARIADAAILIDEPLASGGLGSGPNPYNLLGAALGACKAMTIRLYANRKNWPLSHVQVDVRHRRAGLNARDLFEADVHLEGDLSAEQQARLLEIAERCPVHLTLTRGADVRTILLTTGATPAEAQAGPSHTDCMNEACAD